MTNALRGVYTYADDFFGKRDLTTGSVEGGSGLKCTIVKTAGSPTLASVTPETTGAVALSLDSTSEVQQLSYYGADILAWNAANLLNVKFSIKCATMGAASTAYFGLASAYNATFSSITSFCGFQATAAAGTLKVSTNDGTTSSGQIATGQVLGTGYSYYVIDFGHGLADIRFFGQNSSGQLVRLASGTTFAAAALTNLQFFTRVEKTSAADAPVISLDYYEINYKR